MSSRSDLKSLTIPFGARLLHRPNQRVAIMKTPNARQMRVPVVIYFGRPRWLHPASLLRTRKARIPYRQMSRRPKKHPLYSSQKRQIPPKREPGRTKLRQNGQPRQPDKPPEQCTYDQLQQEVSPHAIQFLKDWRCYSEKRRCLSTRASEQISNAWAAQKSRRHKI